MARDSIHGKAVASHRTPDTAFAGWRRPPPEPPEGFARLAPLLVDGSGKPISTRSEWRRRQKALQQEWMEILGRFPPRVARKTETLSTEVLPDHTRLRLRYRSEAGAARGEYVTNEAYLLLPRDGREKHPGMVVLHQTTDRTIDEPVGIAGREPMHVALHLVRRGYVCIVPRCFLWGYAGTADIRAATRRLLATPGCFSTGMAKMVWDGIRAVDELVTRPEVDRSRIGCIGHSLGGKTALYLGAFDPRVRATVSCEGGVGLSFSNWHDPWYLGAKIQAPSFTRDHHEIIARIAPRPFLLIGGEDADGARSWPYIATNLPIYRLLGAEDQIGLQLTGQGHDFPHAGSQREQTFEWLDHWLGHGRR
jgi:dienelactone hydrolase